MLTRLLRLLNGGQNKSWSELLQSDLKLLSLMFLIAIGLSLVIAATRPENPAELNFNEAPSLTY
jgi:hypothetical protein